MAVSACHSASPSIPATWSGALPATNIASVELDNDGSVRTVAGPRRSPHEMVRAVATPAGVKLMRDDIDLTPDFIAIDSFDVSTGRREVAFSAKREGRSFDIGLITLEGSPINWVPEDSADEVNVSWAPRGNKISYFVRGAGGDVIRTVHIPTSVALTIDFPFAVLKALAWDPAAERFAVTYDSVDASSRVEVMRYGGEERRMAIPPAIKLNLDVVPMGPNAVLLQPGSMRYEERVPLVVWVTDGPRNAWNDARRYLLQNARAACVITNSLDDALWQAIGQTRWIDPARIFVVNTTNHQLPTTNHLTITSGDVPAGRYERSNKIIRVQRAVVESFAARFISEQLKGTSLRGH